jgi:hypothetical protein
LGQAVRTWRTSDMPVPNRHCWTAVIFIFLAVFRCEIRFTIRHDVLLPFTVFRDLLVKLMPLRSLNKVIQ